MTMVDLKAFLPSATVMVITVTATTTDGKPLSEQELNKVFEACDVALELDSYKRKVQHHSTSRIFLCAH
jgi:U4/U6 small nuclear ribonucleoprotein PRP31